MTKSLKCNKYDGLSMEIYTELLLNRLSALINMNE